MFLCTSEEDGLSLVLPQDGFEEPHQRLGELVGEIVLEVDSDVVLQYVDRVLCLGVGGRTLAGRDDHVRNSIAQLRRVPGVPLLHLGGQLDVSLLVGVLLVGFGKLLGDDQLGYVYAVAEEVGDGLLHILDGAHWVAFDEDLCQAFVHHLGHHRTIVTTHSLDSLAVHLGKENHT